MSDYNLGRAQGQIVLDSSGASRGVAEADAAINSLDRRSRRASSGMYELSRGMMAVGAAGVGAFAYAIKVAADFESVMSGVAAVSGATVDQMEAVRKKALQLGADTAYTAAEAGQAMEELVKAGLKVEDVLNGAADAAVTLAAAGEVDLATAASISANAMNVFNLKASELPHIVDLIAGAANSSAIDVYDFGMSLAQAGAQANIVGLDFDDLALGITAMGNAGIKGSDAGTSLKTFLQNLQPTTERQIDLFKRLGITSEDLVTAMNPMGNAFFDSEGSIKSLSEVSGILETALYGMSDAQKSAALEVMFGTDAIRAASIVASTGQQGFLDLADAMTKIKAADVAAARLDNFKGSLKKLKGSIATVLIAIGSQFLPVLQGIADKAIIITNKFNDLDPRVQKIGAIVIGAASAFALLLGSLGMAIHVMSPAVAAIKALTIATSENTVALLASPWFWVIAAIAALVVGLIYAYKHFEGFRDVVQRVIEVARELGAFFMEEVLPKIQAFVATAVEVFKTVISWFTGTLLPAVRSVWSKITGVIMELWHWLEDNVFNTVGAIVEFVVAVFTKLVQFFNTFVLPQLKMIWEILWPIVQFVWDTIVTIIQTAVDIISGIIGFFIDAVMVIWNAFGDNIIQAVTIAWNVIKGIIETVLGIIRGIFNALTGLITGDMDKFLGGLKAIWDAVWGAISGSFKATWDTIKLVLSTALDAIKAAIEIAILAVKTVWSAAWSSIKAVFTTIWDAIKTSISVGVGFITGLWNTLYSTTKKVWGAIGDAIATIIGGIKSTVSGIWDGIVGGFKGAVNTIIDGINWVIEKINSFQIHIHLDIPMAPDIDFDWDGLGLPLIPKLAKGAIVTAQTLAMIGEAGAEAVIPLTNHARALQLMDRSGLTQLVLETYAPNVMAQQAPSPTAAGGATAVRIEHAHFYDQLDLESLMTQAEFALQGMG